jgi:hypothetical protein
MISCPRACWQKYLWLLLQWSTSVDYRVSSLRRACDFRSSEAPAPARGSPQMPGDDDPKAIVTWHLKLAFAVVVAVVTVVVAVVTVVTAVVTVVLAVVTLVTAVVATIPVVPPVTVTRRATMRSRRRIRRAVRSGRTGRTSAEGENTNDCGWHCSSCQDLLDGKPHCCLLSCCRRRVSPFFLRPTQSSLISN